MHPRCCKSYSYCHFPCCHIIVPFQEAERLIARRIHPQTIIAGYRKAADCARESLTRAARDNSSDNQLFTEVSVGAVVVEGGRAGQNGVELDRMRWSLCGQVYFKAS